MSLEKIEFSEQDIEIKVRERFLEYANLDDTNKNMEMLKLERWVFNQDDCKRLENHLKQDEYYKSYFSHRENRKFYFYITKKRWEMLKIALEEMFKFSNYQVYNK